MALVVSAGAGGAWSTIAAPPTESEIRLETDQ